MFSTSFERSKSHRRLTFDIESQNHSFPVYPLGIILGINSGSKESNMKNLNTIKGITKGAIYLITGLLYLIS